MIESEGLVFKVLGNPVNLQLACMYDSSRVNARDSIEVLLGLLSRILGALSHHNCNLVSSRC